MLTWSGFFFFVQHPMLFAYQVFLGVPCASRSLSFSSMLPQFFFVLLCVLTPRAYTAESGTEDSFLSNTRQLIYEGTRSGEGYFHPDGNALIFQSEREPGNPFYQIYLLNLLSGESARVSPGQGKTTCAFFQPGSSRVLFASTHHDPEAPAKTRAELEFRASGKQRRYAWDYDAAMDIFSSQQDGTQVVQLTNTRGYDAEGAFSPDGKKIVFCSTRGAFQRELSAEEKARLERDPAWFGDLYMMNADGTGVRQLTTAPGYDGGPFFSPDGQRIVWRRFDESGMNADIFTMKTDGSDVRRITDFKSMSWAPFYHPSGKYIIFTSNKLGFENFELFVVDAEGGKEPVRVTFTDGFDGLPVFSPDGKRLCWTSNRTADKKSQLFIADWNQTAVGTAMTEVQASTAPGATKQREQIGSASKSEREEVPSHGSKEEDEGVSLASSDSPSIAVADLQKQVTWLADPERSGRMTGDVGAHRAARWLRGYFHGANLGQVGDRVFHEFEFNAGVKIIPAANSLSITGAGEQAQAFTLEKDFRPLAFSDPGEAEGEVVFAGYGLSVPEDAKGARYNSFEGIDVKDKIVLLLRYVPEGVEPARRAQLNRYAGLRYKAMMARERGAKAVLVVAGPNSPQAGELLPLTSDGAAAGSGILAHSISGAVADALLAASGKSLKDVQGALDVENPHADGAFVLPKVRVKLSAGIAHEKKRDQNVVVQLPPFGTTAPLVQTSSRDQTQTKPIGANESATPNHAEPAAPSAPPAQSDAPHSTPNPQLSTPAEYILIGAHYDHLGRGTGTNSMARSGEEGQVHHGADDNASGVAVVMELAAALAEEREQHPEKFKRGVIFALWSGEEMGIIGSAAFAEKPPVPIEQIAAYVNFDMVGRLRENKLTLQGVGSSKLWRRLIEKRNVAAGFNLVLQDDPYLPTDTTSFYPKRIPVLNFFTGAHEDYHRPTDTADKINYEGTERIAKFAQQLVLDLVSAPERPDLARVERSDSGSGSRETLRAYLGTIPDYTTEVKGVKISGARAGSPAEKSGLKGGDVIVEFAGQKIANIYDYTYALDAVKIGQPVKIAVEREGKRVEVEVTPEARK